MRTLLIDADIVAYQASSVHEETFIFGDQECLAVDSKLAKETAIDTVEHLANHLKADRIIICLSSRRNWRKELWPQYKANRADVPKPQSLRDVKKALADEYGWEGAPRLEADDVMGILSTHKHKGERIIVSDDKDMMGVPGLLYMPRLPNLGVIEISRIEANRFHMYQTVIGDAVDNIPGVPGLGAKSIYAQDIINGVDDNDLWGAVLKAYGSKGLCEERALLMARMTHILRHNEYVRPTQEVKLWKPHFMKH